MLHHFLDAGRRFWFLLVRNRIAIAIASLCWLLYRSGTQPRRLTYPCQQAAIFNVGAFLGGLLPALFLSRKKPCPHTVGRVAVVRRQLVVTVLLLAAAFFGVEGVQWANDALTDPIRPDIPARVNPPQQTDVGIVHASSVPVSDAEVESMVQEAVALAGGLDDLIDVGDQVVIKLNLVMSGFYPGDGVTTDPRVARAVVRMCQSAGAGEVIMADGAGGGTGGRDVTRYAFRDSGYDSNMDMIDDETGVQLVDLNDSGGLDVYDPNKVTEVNIPDGVIRTHYWMPNIIMNCDVLINIPLIKNHWNTGMTGALKNRIGCAPSDIYNGGGDQSKQGIAHSVNDFPRNVTGDVYPVPPATTEGNYICQYTVVDLNLVRPNDFVVMDGLVGNTDGPIGNDAPIPYMGLIVAGRDSVAVDSVECLLMGYNHHFIDHIAWANQRELGTSDTAYIRIFGERIMDVRRNFPTSHPPVEFTARADSTPPTLTSIVPLDGAAVSGQAVITAQGTDNGTRGVVQARLSVNGEFIEAIPGPSSSYSFNWDTTGWQPGNYDVTVTLYDDALNQTDVTRQYKVNMYAPADFDQDEDVDMEDYGHFQSCLTGNNQGPPMAGCENADLSGDGDVDQEDLGIFQNCLSGSGVIADVTCANP
jgi:uncharacterized protein (DUF362 family)